MDSERIDDEEPFVPPVQASKVITHRRLNTAGAAPKHNIPNEIEREGSEEGHHNIRADPEGGAQATERDKVPTESLSPLERIGGVANVGEGLDTLESMQPERNVATRSQSISRDIPDMPVAQQVVPRDLDDRSGGNKYCKTSSRLQRRAPCTA